MEDIWIWILIGLVALAVLGAVVAGGTKKKRERDREEAAGLRSAAYRERAVADRKDAEVRSVEAEAARAQAEADRLEALARERRSDVETQRASYAERLSKADEIDPDVDADGTRGTRGDARDDASSGEHRREG